jgi:hypothetical protein
MLSGIGSGSQIRDLPRHETSETSRAAPASSRQGAIRPPDDPTSARRPAATGTPVTPLLDATA